MNKLFSILLIILSAVVTVYLTMWAGWFDGWIKTAEIILCIIATIRVLIIAMSNERGY